MHHTVTLCRLTLCNIIWYCYITSCYVEMHFKHYITTRYLTLSDFTVNYFTLQNFSSHAAETSKKFKSASAWKYENGKTLSSSCKLLTAAIKMISSDRFLKNCQMWNFCMNNFQKFLRNVDELLNVGNGRWLLWKQQRFLVGRQQRSKIRMFRLRLTWTLKTAQLNYRTFIYNPY